MCMVFAFIYVCTCVSLVHGGQKRWLELLGLEWQIVPASVWVLRIKPGSLEEHQVLLAAESPPVPMFNVFICLFM